MKIGTKHSMGKMARGLVTAWVGWLCLAATPAWSAQVNCTPDPGFNTCVRITNEGAQQTFTVPPTVTSVRFKLWGAGGGGSAGAGLIFMSGFGGAGGFAAGTLAVTPGQNLSVVVGSPGAAASSSPTFGGGAGGGNAPTAPVGNPTLIGGSGGGRSSVHDGANTELITAGGGGGSAAGTAGSVANALASSFAGAGGQDAAYNDGCVAGIAATAGSAGAGGTGGTGGVPGANGSALTGGVGGNSPTQNAGGGGGGGGGHFGGGGGQGQLNVTQTCSGINSTFGQDGSGAGGSNFVSGLLTAPVTTAGNQLLVANSTDSQYVSGIGIGGPRTGGGGAGLVVIQFNVIPTTTLQLAKTWAAGSIAGNTVTIGATTGGAANTAAFTATAPNAANSGAAVTVNVGNAITLPAEGGANVGNYTTTVACTGGHTLSGTNGQQANTLTITSTSAAVCTYTNTPRTTTLQLAKSWAAGSITGNVVSIGATTGGSNNTAAFSATAPTAANSGAAVTVTVGNVITLPAEGGTNVGNYTTTVACTGGHTLSGTNGQQANTLTITSSTAAVCTYTNTVISRPQMRINKAANGGGGTFSFTGNNGYPGQSITLAANSGGETVLVNLTAANVQTTITEVDPGPGWTTTALAGWNCADRANNDRIVGTFNTATRTYTIPAADVLPNSQLVCHFVNTRVPPRLTVSKVSNGGTGTFSFSGNNGVANHSITTTTAGTPVAGAVQTLTAANVATTITEAALTGFAATGATCTGLAGGASSTFDPATRTLTIPAAGVADGANIACTVTNTALKPTLQIGKQTGGATGTFTFTGNNGFPSTTVTTTTGDGAFYFSTPVTLTASNVAVTVTEADPGRGWVTDQNASLSCSDLTSGRGVVAGTTYNTATRTFTIPAAGVLPDSQLRCHFINRRVPQMRVHKTSNGGVGTFTFTGNNGYPGQTATTVTSGVEVQTTPVNLTTWNVVTTLTETDPGVGWSVAADSSYLCYDFSLSSNQAVGSFDVATRTYTIPAANVLRTSDFACVIINTRVPPRLTVSKVSNGGTGTFSFSGNNGVANHNITTTTAGTPVAGAVQTLTAANVATTITEAAPAGFTATGATCTGLVGGASSTFDPVTRTVTIPPAGVADGATIACTFTNARITATLQLAKSWAAGSITGNVVTIGATTGGAANTVSFDATAPTAANSGAPVTVNIGDVITLPAEGGANVGNYTTTVACSGGHTLSGTDGQQSNTLTITSGTPAVCTYLNTPRTTRVTVTKVSDGGVGTFNFAGSNGVANHAITTVTAGTGVAGAVQTLTAAGTATTVSEATLPLGFALKSIACTGLGAGGTATPTINGAAGGSVVLDAAATAPGSDIQCTFTNARLNANLSITKSNTYTDAQPHDQANDTVARGITTYTMVVSNGGPDAADGAVVRDQPVSGLGACAVTSCIPSGGASCPANTADFLSPAGATIATFPATGTLRFTVRCDVE